MVDFKTDRVGADGVGAARRALLRRSAPFMRSPWRGSPGTAAIRTAHVFLERPDEPVVEVFGPDELRRPGQASKG